MLAIPSQCAILIFLVFVVSLGCILTCSPLPSKLNAVHPYAYLIVNKLYSYKTHLDRANWPDFLQSILRVNWDSGE